jgi:hypothetical protein
MGGNMQKLRNRKMKLGKGEDACISSYIVHVYE